MGQRVRWPESLKMLALDPPHASRVSTSHSTRLPIAFKPMGAGQSLNPQRLNITGRL